jgi:Na+/melibiose symporter-like transporter
LGFPESDRWAGANLLGLPPTLALACVLAMRGYKLTATKHAKIRAALALRDATAAP